MREIHLARQQMIKKINPIFANELNIVNISFSVKVCEEKFDGLALCNLDGLGRVMVVGITLWVVGRHQDPTPRHALFIHHSC